MSQAQKNTLFWAAKKDILLIKLFYVTNNFTQCGLFSHQFITNTLTLVMQVSVLHGNTSQPSVNVSSKLEPYSWIDATRGIKYTTLYFYDASCFSLLRSAGFLNCYLYRDERETIYSQYF